MTKVLLDIDLDILQRIFPDPCEEGHDFETVEAVSDYQDPGSPSGHGQTYRTVRVCSRCGEEDSI